MTLKRAWELFLFVIPTAIGAWGIFRARRQAAMFLALNKMTPTGIVELERKKLGKPESALAGRRDSVGALIAFQKRAILAIGAIFGFIGAAFLIIGGKGLLRLLSGPGR